MQFIVASIITISIFCLFFATSDALAFNEVLSLFFLREVRTFERINKTSYKILMN